jgi:hypothetical protein
MSTIEAILFSILFLTNAYFLYLFDIQKKINVKLLDFLIKISKLPIVKKEPEEKN